MPKERKRPDAIVYTATADEKTCSVTVQRHDATWAGFGYNLTGHHRSWTPAEVEIATRPAAALARLRRERESYLADERRHGTSATARYERLTVRLHTTSGSAEDKKDDLSHLEHVRRQVQSATEGALREERLIALVDAMLGEEN